MALTPAQRQARYRARHPERVAAYYAANNKKNAAKYRARNPQRVKERMRKWNAENGERAKDLKRRYYEENKPAFIARARSWIARNPGYKQKVNARNCAKRGASKLKATPGWANNFFISEIYDLARLRTKYTGFKWHVDHIVPLRSKLVCGLHVENNLQVIPAKENHRKGNRFLPDMPAVGSPS